MVDEVPGRTTGELRTEVRERARSADPDFAAAADLFDLAWYGDADAGADDVRRLVDHAGRVLVAAERDLVAAAASPAAAPWGEEP